MRIFCFILLNSYVFVSCTFQPEGDHFVEVEPVISGIFKINIINHGDTIYLSKNANITYELDLGDNDAQLVQIKIDGEEFKNLIPPNNSFNLIGNNYSTGFHTLEFIVFSNTGSGSLADRTGMEHLAASVFFILYVDIDPPHKISITNFENDGGRLKVTWEKYDRHNFTKYVLCKGQSINSPYRIIATIEDANINYAYDDNYIGGEEYYWVEAYAYSPGNNQPAIGYDSAVNFHASRIVSMGKNELTGQINVIWDTCRFNTAFYSYRIRARSDESRDYYPKEELITDIFQVSNVFEELPFGGPLDVILEVSSNNFNRTYDTLDYEVGEKSIPFHHLDYHPELKRYFRIYFDTLHMYGEGISEVITILPDLDNSSFEKSFVTSDYVFLLHNTKLYKYSTTSLELQEIIELQDIVGSFDYTSYPSITENGLMVFQKIKRQTANIYDSLKMINLGNREVLLTHKWVVQFQNYAISRDGRFFYVDDNIYEWNGTEYVVFKENPILIQDGENRRWMGSMITGNYQVLSLFRITTTNDFECVRYDIINESAQENITYNGAASYYDFDMTNDVLYSQSISEFGNLELYLIRDVDNESLDIIREAKMDYRRYKLFGDTLYCSIGYKLFIEPE